MERICSLSPGWQAEAVALYNRVSAGLKLPYGRRITTQFLERRLFGSQLWSSDCSRLLLDDAGRVIGMALANRRSNPGVGQGERLLLHWLGIDPLWQGRGLGGQLLRHMQALARQGGQRAVASALQWSGLWPGVVEGLQGMEGLVARSGGEWQPGELFLRCAVQGRSWTEQGEVPIVGFTQAHAAGLRGLLQENFSIGWQHETLSRIDQNYEPFNGYGLSETYCAAPVGRDLLIAEVAGEVVGFCVLQAGEEGMAFFGPVGLRPEWRKRGIGSALLHAALRRTQDIGCQEMGLWTNQTLAEGFYLPLGLQRGCVTRHVVWKSHA